MIGSAYQEVRHISHNLMPQALEEHGLVGSFEKLFTEINENGKLQIEFKYHGDFENLNKGIVLEMYSIGMELVNNVLKHSGASKAYVGLININEKIMLSVQDNGVGVKHKKEGHGLKQISERVKKLNGTISSTYESGSFEVYVEIPSLIEKDALSFENSRKILGLEMKILL